MSIAIPARLVSGLGALGLVLAFAAPARAQRATLNAASDSSAVALTRIMPDSAMRSASNDVAPPTLSAALVGMRAGVHARETARPNHPMAAATHANLGQARAMMIVGAAALVAGAIIGDTPGTVIMVGGAVIGLVGLYDYLQ